MLFFCLCEYRMKHMWDSFPHYIYPFSPYASDFGATLYYARTSQWTLLFDSRGAFCVYMYTHFKKDVFILPLSPSFSLHKSHCFL